MKISSSSIACSSHLADCDSCWRKGQLSSCHILVVLPSSPGLGSGIPVALQRPFSEMCSLGVLCDPSGREIFGVMRILVPVEHVGTRAYHLPAFPNLSDVCCGVFISVLCQAAPPPLCLSEWSSWRKTEKRPGFFVFGCLLLVLADWF